MMLEFTNKTYNCDNRQIFDQLPDDSIDLIITDPPYKDYQSNRPVAHHKVKKIEEVEFDIPFFIEQSARVLKPGCHFYCWCDHRSFPGIVSRIVELQQEQTEKRSPHYLVYKNCLIWVKSNHGSGDLKGNWAPQHEFIIFATKGKGNPLKGKRRSNVFFKRTGNGIEFIKKVSNYKFNHGTTKPVDILKIIIEASSDVGDVVFDPYAGTMSVGEACVETGRKYLLVEIDEGYFRSGMTRLSSTSVKPG